MQRNQHSRGSLNESRHPASACLARRLREWRKSTGFPLKYLADELKVSVSTVSQWENGRRFPSLQRLERLAALMQMRVCCMLYDGPGPCPHGARLGLR
jgi:DNA-binding transcriptional regulator YiaG